MPQPAIDRLTRLWRSLGHRPGGRWLFSRILGRAVPYTGTIRARVLELEPGRATARIEDRRRLRNHLRSVHALALGNLGELATGLAFNAGLPADARGIPVRLTIDYLKKARGPITATCVCEPPASSEEAEYDVAADLSDEAGDTVARVTARWRVGPKR
ncbi:MAG: hotdog fold domain-containing protein [Thermoanaerobaculia bacterium]|nr:hotdog fold domain-containing protein [Thermoanaerobaculia bacterium]